MPGREQLQALRLSRGPGWWCSSKLGRLQCFGERHLNAACSPIDHPSGSACAVLRAVHTGGPAPAIAPFHKRQQGLWLAGWLPNEQHAQRKGQTGLDTAGENIWDCPVSREAAEAQAGWRLDEQPLCKRGRTGLDAAGKNIWKTFRDG